jgi:hypothetical protein
VAELSKTPPPGGATPDSAKSTPPQNLPAKDVETSDADRVKGGVKKTMQTQV